MYNYYYADKSLTTPTVVNALPGGSVGSLCARRRVCRLCIIYIIILRYYVRVVGIHTYLYCIIHVMIIFAGQQTQLNESTRVAVVP